MQKIVTKEIKCLHCKIKRIIDRKMPRNIHLNVTQMQIMTYLFKHEKEEICQKDLESETHLKKASITGAIDALEEMNLVERVQASEDKRRNIIKFTPLAKKEKQNIVSVYDLLNKVLVKGLKQEEIETFFHIIETMKMNLDKEEI